MKKRLRLRRTLTLIVILLLAGFSALVAWPGSQAGWSDVPQSWFAKKTYQLGLDLQGGTHLVYRADTSAIPSNETEEAIAAVRDVIERRINLFGVAEPRVEVNSIGDEDRIIVELAGVMDVNKAIQLIGETPQLDFRELNPEAETETALTDDEKKQIKDSEVASEKQARELIARITTGEDFAALAKEFSADGSAQDGGDLSWFERGVMVPEFEEAAFALKIGAFTQRPVKTQFGYHIIKKTDERTADGKKEIRASHILLRTLSEDNIHPAPDPWKVTALTGKYLKRAQVTFDSNTQEPQVSLEFNGEGAALFEEITERNINKQVAIFLDGYPISAPVVQQKITGGEAVIYGNFTLEQARELSRRLTAGALPVPIELVVQQNVGPALGKLSVEQSLKAGFLGLLLVALFMILWYRLPGVLSVFALGIYILIVLTLFKLVPVTLTLAGLAGFILSVGMAVDGNVLVFERMKEELKRGKPLDLAIEDGFARAWTSIRDGGLSTLITCALLFMFGTSFIKGFGLVLGIGVIMSMFSAIVITRTFLRLLARPSMNRALILFGVRKSKIV